MRMEIAALGLRFLRRTRILHCERAIRPDARNEGSAAMHELHGHYLEDMSVGMTEIYSRTVTETDIVLFCGISGDSNPVHLDEQFAKNTMFKGRIAHGMLTASFISTVLGTKLPGPGCIYISQNLKFKAPVRIGETVRARVTVAAVDQDRGRITVSTVCHVGDTQVIDGEAVLMVPRRASLAQAAE
jgi:3-hydroxybutyryl-CoA dehydratase